MDKSRLEKYGNGISSGDTLAAILRIAKSTFIAARGGMLGSNSLDNFQWVMGNEMQHTSIFNIWEETVTATAQHWNKRIK